MEIVTRQIAHNHDNALWYRTKLPDIIQLIMKLCWVYILTVRNSFLTSLLPWQDDLLLVF